MRIPPRYWKLAPWVVVVLSLFAVLWISISGGTSTSLPLVKRTTPSVEKPPVETAAQIESGSVGTNARLEVKTTSDSQKDAVYAVFTAEGSVVAGASIWLYRDGSVFEQGITSASGLFTCESPSADLGVILVGAPSWAPQFFPVPLGPGKHSVALKEGATLSGWTLEADGTPVQALSLRLRILGETQALGSDLKAEHQLQFPPDQRFPGLLTETSAEGAFSFRGLTNFRRGQLYLPTSYRFCEVGLTLGAERPNVMPLANPRTGLVLHVERRMVVKGRVVDLSRSGAAPVAGAVVIPDLVFQGGAKARSAAPLYADDEGRFEFALSNPSIRGGAIIVGPPGGEFHRRIEVDPVDVQDELDLGDLPLQERRETQELALRVTNPALEPIQGAVAVIDGSLPASAATDDSGRTSVPNLVPGVTLITLHARGFQDTFVRVPSVLPEELEVIMLNAACLEVRVLLLSGEPAKNLQMYLSSQEPPYRSEANPKHFNGYRRSGSSFPLLGHKERGVVTAKANGLRTGHVIFNDLQPGLPFDLVLEGRFSGSILEQPVPPLQADERRVLEITIENPARTLVGRVLDEDGEPILEANVSIRIPPWDPTVYKIRELAFGVDKDGRFELGSIHGLTIHLSLWAPGYEKMVVARFLVPETEAVVEFYLRPARQVTVLVLDEEGGEVPAQQIYVESEPGTFLSIGRKVEGHVGKYLIRDLPPEDVNLTVRVHATDYKRICHDWEETMRFVVPVLGDLHPTVQLFDSSVVNERWLLCLVPAVGESPSPRYAYLHEPNFSGVLPGDYILTLRHFMEGFDRLDTFEEKSLRMPVTVVAKLVAYITVAQQP